MEKYQLADRAIAIPDVPTLKPYKSALLLAIPYLLFGLLYIYFSGRFASKLAGNVDQLEFIERYKGYAFILISAAGLYFLAAWLLHRVLRHEQSIFEYRSQIIRSDQQAMTGLFASSIAHDINNMLMGVEFVVETLNSEKAPDNDLIAMLRKANENLKQLTGMLGRVSGRQFSDASEEFDFAAFVREIIGIGRMHKKVRNCSLKYDGPETCLFSGRKILISQMLLNLLINAGDATGHKGKILVRVGDETSEVTLEVHDDGLGIPENMVETIVQPLFSTKKDGCGLGLLSLDVCTKVHGGSFKIGKSEFGGACFFVRFPKKH